MNEPHSDHTVNEWKTWQFSRSLSQRTVDERAATVIRMASWCNVQPENATTADVVTWLARGGSWSANTRWTYYTSLSAWFRWLQRQGRRTDNPMLLTDAPKRRKGEPHPLTNSEMQRLLSQPLRPRTDAMVNLAAFQGFRAHEIAKVRGEDFDLVSRTVHVIGKGAFSATLPLHSRVATIAAHMPRRGFWFPGRTNGHQRRESVCQTIKDAIVRAGVSGSAHSLRHWFASALLEAGVDLRVVQLLLRHQNLATTEIYTLVSDRRRADGIEMLDPWRMEPLAKVSPALLADALGDLDDDLDTDAGERLAG